MQILGTIASSRLKQPPPVYLLNQTGDNSTYLVGAGARANSTSDIYLGGYNNDAPSGILFKYDKDGALIYQKTYTGTAIFGYNTVLDSAENVYWLSRAQSVIGNGWVGAHVAKLNPSGVSQWQRSYYQGSSNQVQPQNIAIDSSDNIYVTGYVSPSPLSGFLIKRNSSGTLQWQNLVTASGGCVLYSGALDSSANVYTSGEFGSNSGLMKFNTSGTLQWQRQISGGSFPFLYKTACTNSSVYVAGWANNGINVGMLAKFDASNGSTTWVRILQGVQPIYGYQAVLDSSENIYFAASIDPGTTIIAKYNSSGTIQWQRTLSSAAGITIVNANGITVSGNNIYLTGRTTASGTNRTFLAVLPTDGTKTGTYSVGGNSFTYAASSYTDSNFSFTNSAGGASVSNPGFGDTSDVYNIGNSNFTSNTTII